MRGERDETRELTTYIETTPEPMGWRVAVSALTLAAGLLPVLIVWGAWSAGYDEGHRWGDWWGELRLAPHLHKVVIDREDGGVDTWVVKTNQGYCDPGDGGFEECPNEPACLVTAPPLCYERWHSLAVPTCDGGTQTLVER